MKKIPLVLGFLVLAVLIFWHFTKPNIPDAPVYLSHIDQISEQKPVPKHQAFDIIERINRRNKAVRSLFATVEMTVQQQISVQVTGQLAMQKDHDFRLTVSHRFTGLEMDIGSNNQIFWFWSKRLRPNALYFAKHQNLSKTMLKTPLNPNWMMESLNLSAIDLSDISVSRYGSFWALTQYRIAATGESVKVVTLISDNAILGHYLYNSQDKMMASSECQSFYTTTTGVLIPKDMLIIWVEEGVSMQWHIINPQINLNLPISYWTIPAIRPSVELGN